MFFVLCVMFVIGERGGIIMLNLFCDDASKDWEKFLCSSILEDDLTEGEVDTLLGCILDCFLRSHGYSVGPNTCDYIAPI